MLLGMECIFCKIASGEIPAKKLYEDEQAVAFADIDPKAPVHVLVIPKRHVASLAELGAPSQDGDQDEALIGHLQLVAAQLAREQKLDDGYRVVINTGPEGGQTVDHLHLHLLGGRSMHWPPG